MCCITLTRWSMIVLQVFKISYTWYIYHPSTKLREGNAFVCVCLFTCSQGVPCGHYSWYIGSRCMGPGPDPPNGHGTLGPQPGLKPPATDIWWSRPVQTRSLEDSSAPLWSLYLVAIEVTGMVGASYWNALLLERFLKLFWNLYLRSF